MGPRLPVLGTSPKAESRSTLNYAAAIPEPSTGVLLLLGLGGIAWLRGRHRRTPVSSPGI
ncbi:MAG: PEP-CTERM sorting domain-containing protein [Verrucomicrobia bacterium]|nr:PEP-CTERM sorting domain-containing protein [Verrucomicrobiota bacterium]NCA17879.1 PEP-CTERM sorting domain-containing protein [Betaproteobacteria bacterium]